MPAPSPAVHFYAVWMGSVDAEFLVELEPLANVLVLGGLLLALRAGRAGTSRWRSMIAGAPLGLAVSVKIWWIVPVVAIIASHAFRRRSVLPGTAMAGGAIAAAVALNLPFFVPVRSTIGPRGRDDCVRVDSPAAQIRLEASSRGLSDGCPNWIDVMGPTHGKYRSSAPRVHNPRWQRAFPVYLRRGQAVMLVDGPITGASAAFRARVAAGGVLATADGYTVYRVP